MMKLKYKLMAMGLMLIFVSCKGEQKSYENSAEQESTEMNTETSVEKDKLELPEGMFIPDPEEAMTPEVSHLNKYFYRESEEYTEIELRYFEKWNSPGEVLIRCEDNGETINCFIYIVKDESYHDLFKGTAYKQDDNNLYIGNIFSTIDGRTVIGKYIISYKIDEVIMSVAYYDFVEVEQETGIPKEGVYHLYYEMQEFEQEAIESMGNPVNDTDYSEYTGRWFPIYPVGAIAQHREEYTYMDLDISSDGKIYGCISQYEGNSSANSYAEVSGTIEDNKCIMEYEDDGYGHGGTITLTFYENGIKAYIDETGEPNDYGFPTGNNYFMRQE